MKECKCGRIPPCYSGKKFRIHEELEKIPRVAPLSEETEQEMINTLENFSKSLEAELKVCELINLICEDIKKSIKSDDMEKKKTKKMTKAEAFEYLKGKKIKCYDGIANIFDEPTKVEKFLLEIGCLYHFANHVGWRDWYWPLYGFIVDSKGEIYVAFEDQIDFFKQNLNEPISVDDILSIEIVEEKCELEFNYDKVVELAKPLMLYLNEVGCLDGIRVSQLGIVHEPMSTLIFDNGIGRIE